MGLSMFSAQSSPIAIDFGSSSVKLLQIEPGERPSVLAAVGLRIPESIRGDKDGQMEYLERQLPRMLRKGRFRGKRAVCSIPSGDTFVQHLQIMPTEGFDNNELVGAQLQTQMSMPPRALVTRCYEVTEVRKDGQTLAEVICFAINRNTVMRYVELLKKCKLETVAVHSEVIGMLEAFRYLHRDSSESGGTMLYVDLGWGSTKAAIIHGKKLAFARCIQIGGRHIDERIAKRLGCDLASARAQRISEQVLSTGGGPGPEGSDPTAVAVAEGEGGGGPDADVAEVAESIAEELSMSLRYHQSLFRGRKIDRMIFLGGEARNVGLCQRIAKTLRLPAQLGDPLTQLVCKRSLRTPGLALGQPQPGWAVVCGLCTAPTDL